MCTQTNHDFVFIQQVKSIPQKTVCSSRGVGREGVWRMASKEQEGRQCLYDLTSNSLQTLVWLG